MEKKSGQWAGRQKKTRQKKNPMRVDRRTKEAIIKWNQMTALRFQTTDISGFPAGKKRMGTKKGGEKTPNLRQKKNNDKMRNKVLTKNSFILMVQEEFCGC